jgi:TATA-binding protein-associated factor Taf7
LREKPSPKDEESNEEEESEEEQSEEEESEEEQSEEEETEFVVSKIVDMKKEVVYFSFKLNQIGQGMEI